MERKVWPHKAKCEKPWLVLLHQFVEGLYCNACVVPINIPVVFNLCSLERRAMNQSSGRTFSIERHHTIFIFCIDSLVFRKCATRSCWASETLSIRLVIPRVLFICHPPMEYLSAVYSGIAMSNKVLWQCYDLRVEITKVCSVFNHTNCVGSGSSK